MLRCRFEAKATLLRPRHRGAVLRLCAVLVAAGASSWNPGNAEGQQHDCVLRVQPHAGEAGYRARGQRCEGMFLGLQSAPLGVQVVSLVKAGLRYGPDDRMLYVHVPPLVGTRGPLLIRGQAREANLNWALDASITPGGFVPWNLGEVIVPLGLASGRIGIAAEASTGTAARGGPLYVPVGLSGRLQLDMRRDSLELVVRVPGAAALRWSLTGSEPYLPAERLNVDGYFRIMVPPLPPSEPPREAPLSLFWRPRYQEWVDAPVQLRVYRW